jgi:LEM3 (ligand-effect modulator 3) family / CDC50 family
MHVMRLRMCQWCPCRYVRSLDSKQLGGKNSTSGACEPVQYLGDNGKNNSLPNQGRVNPCGLIAYSNFNDTFAVSVGGRAQTIDVSLSCQRQQAAHTVFCYEVTHICSACL